MSFQFCKCFIQFSFLINFKKMILRVMIYRMIKLNSKSEKIKKIFNSLKNIKIIENLQIQLSIVLMFWVWTPTIQKKLIFYFEKYHKLRREIKNWSLNLNQKSKNNKIKFILLFIIVFFYSENFKRIFIPIFNFTVSKRLN